jgi:hypothetical protein
VGTSEAESLAVSTIERRAVTDVKIASRCRPSMAETETAIRRLSAAKHLSKFLLTHNTRVLIKREPSYQHW